MLEVFPDAELPHDLAGSSGRCVPVLLPCPSSAAELEHPATVLTRAGLPSRPLTALVDGIPHPDRSYLVG